jgi:chromosome segregation ATPase
MADVLQTLEAEVSRMLAGMRRLSDDNIALRAELQAASMAQRQLEARLDEARSRVESALAAAGSLSSPMQTIPPSTPPSKAD